MSEYIVYVMDDDTAKPTGQFLAVAESVEEADELMEKWWKAFHNGEKAEPRNYGGVSHAPIAEFDEWKAPEEME